jgi:hypothetical protein
MFKTKLMTLAVFAVSGCATVQIPTDRLERNEASIRAAEELGADSVPNARLHLQFAKDQTESAKRMAAAGDDRCVLELSRAEADAELALGLAREVSVHADAVRAAEGLKALQSRAAP